MKEIAMIKLIFMLKRKDGMTREQFRVHYEGSHVKMARRYVGHLLESYERNYINEISAPPTETGAETVSFQYDVITEMRLNALAAVDKMAAVFADPEVGPLFIEDEHRFLDRKSILMLRCEEVSTGTSL
jgi:hypothetical protein